MRRFIVLVLCTVSTAAFAQTSSFRLHVFVSARTIYVKAPPSWTEGGFGRFDVGANTADHHRTVNLQVAQLGFDWTPARWFLVHADGVARRLPSGSVGKDIGIVQAYADLFSEHLRLRAGSFWLPTSRENVDPLWTSRYTITFSALNTWIGQEVRPLGADLQFSPNFYFNVGATAFRGNDTMGTVLSDRGWVFGNRLSVYDETIALPPTDEITKPIGRDLDSRNGYSERIRISLPERAMLQFTHIDNRAEIRPAREPEVPWLTKFNIVGGEVGTTSPTTLAAEWMSGDTTLAFPGGTFTLDFDTAYVLASHKKGHSRWTARVERFSTRSHRRSADDSSREHGHAFTVAWLREASDHVRAGLEYVRVKGDRPGAVSVGFDPRTGGSTITVELRIAY
ncbi:MAG TPA: hypothetical protein VGS96_04235 [Thermoanaerobaculia bacterium]|nr:hypothetical protein [Thermoanaerobaculia bacterium]